MCIAPCCGANASDHETTCNTAQGWHWKPENYNIYLYTCCHDGFEPLARENCNCDVHLKIKCTPQ